MIAIPGRMALKHEATNQALPLPTFVVIYPLYQMHAHNYPL